MTKKEFFSYLEKRLAVLNKAERDDILAEFDQHINNKIAGGSSEEEAIADFGDPEEFVEEILEAYKVDPEYNRDDSGDTADAAGERQKNVGSILKNFSSAVNAIADAFFQKSKRELFTILLKFLVLIAVLAVIKQPLDWLIYTFTGVFRPFGDGVYNFIDTIISVVYNVVYMLVVCYTVYLFVARTFLADKGYKAFDPSEIKFSGRRNKNNAEKNSDSDGKENEVVSDEKFDSVNSQNADLQNDGANPQDAEFIDVTPADENAMMATDRQILLDIKAKGHKFREDMREKQAEKAKREKTDDGAFLHLFSICLKVLVVFLMIPVLIYALFNIVGLGATIALGIYGAPTMGLLLIALGSLLCVGVFIWFVFRLVFANTKDSGRASAQNEPEQQ